MKCLNIKLGIELNSSQTRRISIFISGFGLKKSYRILMNTNQYGLETIKIIEDHLLVISHILQEGISFFK